MLQIQVAAKRSTKKAPPPFSSLSPLSLFEALQIPPLPPSLFLHALLHFPCFSILPCSNQSFILMATMVCRGLQSSLDSHLADQRTFIFPPFELPLKHPFPDPSISFIDSDQSHILNPSPHARIPTSGAGDGGWSLLQSLAPPASKQESVYVHPLTKRFNPTGLSEKSLKLCTENLGNETGSDMIENNIFSPEIHGEELQRKWERKSHLNSNLHSNSHRLPPPLTTIRETESFRVRPHREEGRLIIAAVRTPAMAPCLLAERSGGRLRLCFVKTEESEEVDGGDEEIGDEMETVVVTNEGNGNDNGRPNLEQLSIATN